MGASLLPITLLAGCVAAWHPPTPGRFDLVVPDGWTVTRNYRWLGADTVVLDGEGASISVNVRREVGTGHLPLDLVASVRALSWGRRVGVENAILAEHEIEVDARRAAAVTGLRRWRTARTAYTMVLMRGGGWTVELVLHAPEHELDPHAAAWAAFLSGFRLSCPPEPDGPLYEDDLWRR